jgi:hypothetical protein
VVGSRRPTMVAREEYGHRIAAPPKPKRSFPILSGAKAITASIRLSPVGINALLSSRFRSRKRIVTRQDSADTQFRELKQLRNCTERARLSDNCGPIGNMGDPPRGDVTGARFASPPLHCPRNGATNPDLLLCF